MSIDFEDIDAAIAAGVMPQAQADALRKFVAERRRTKLEQAGAEDERFRFMSGFNDFFFAIGIVLLGAGMVYFTRGEPLPSLIAAIIVWALSELLVRRMRLVLPGLLLSLFFIFFVYLAVPSGFDTFRSPPFSRDQTISGFVLSTIGLTGPVIGVVAKALIGTAAASLYYWRFRLPFTLLPIAGSLVLVVVSLIMFALGPIPAALDSLIFLACGTTVFAIAMAFDVSDRDRMTRRSDCAFWLHLLAAPLIVHSLISLITPSLAGITNNIALAILLIVAILAIVAIAIDRRALLVSALAYIGFVIAFAASALTGQNNPTQGAIFFTTLLILGAFVIVLGVGWQPLRKRLVALLPSALRSKLPPVPHPA